MSERKLKLVKPERAPARCKTASEAFALMAQGEIVLSNGGFEYKREGDEFYVRWPRDKVPPGVEPRWLECNESLVDMPYDWFWGGGAITTTRRPW